MWTFSKNYGCGRTIIFFMYSFLFNNKILSDLPLFVLHAINAIDTCDSWYLTQFTRSKTLTLTPPCSNSVRSRGYLSISGVNIQTCVLIVNTCYRVLDLPMPYKCYQVIMITGVYKTSPRFLQPLSLDSSKSWLLHSLRKVTSTDKNTHSFLRNLICFQIIVKKKSQKVL